MTMNKEAVLMTNFDGFKQKAKDTMETIADKSIELYKIAEEKTKLLAKITRLNAEVALEKSTVRRLYKEIGKKYYELHKSSPEEALEQTCLEVTSSLKCITAKQKEIDELKKAYDMGRKEDIEINMDNEDDDNDDDKDIEVEIIIEDFKNKPQQQPDAEPDILSKATDADDEDIISKSPPEFKL
jgi:hypothetical protein